ncbi:putative Fis family transcriptional regulator (plasmid) [Pararobbsia alpina]|uniref:hypothetical protein n=1 Tax=Pararobbsia alpina TaxID=621374 RepID=UPI0039A4F867
MTATLRRNPSAQAELLTFLVISQLFARNTTGHWMTVEDFIGSSIIWPSTGYHSNDVVRRSMLASRALKPAQDINVAGVTTINGAALLTMFDDKTALIVLLSRRAAYMSTASLTLGVQRGMHKQHAGALVRCVSL